MGWGAIVTLLSSLRGRKTLLRQMVRRDFERRFVGSTVGWIWGLVHPLVQLGVWSFVFHYCLQMKVPEGQGTENYPVYLFCGYLPWMLFQDVVQRSATSLVENANLITKTVFPSEMIPVSIFLSALVNHALTVLLALVAVAMWGGGLTPMAGLVLIYWIPLALLGVGVGWMVSSLQVYLRDTAQVTLVVLTLWFWLTPIFMTAREVPERFRFLISFNPLAYAVTGYRERLLAESWPNWTEFSILLLFSAGVFAAGGAIFRQLKRGFADVL